MWPMPKCCKPGHREPSLCCPIFVSFVMIRQPDESCCADPRWTHCSRQPTPNESTAPFSRCHLRQKKIAAATPRLSGHARLGRAALGRARGSHVPLKNPASTSAPFVHFFGSARTVLVDRNSVFWPCTPTQQAALQERCIQRESRRPCSACFASPRSSISSTSFDPSSIAAAIASHHARPVPSARRVMKLKKCAVQLAAARPLLPSPLTTLRGKGSRLRHGPRSLEHPRLLYARPATSLAARQLVEQHSLTKPQSLSLLLSESPSEPSGSGQPGHRPQGISDHEYKTRVGKACRVIVESLPDFMHKGVVDLEDLECDHHGSAQSDSASSKGPLAAVRSRWSAAKGLLPMLSPFLGQSLLRRAAPTHASPARATRPDEVFDSLYHPSIAFEFRPPLPHIGIGKDGPSNVESSSSISNARHSGNVRDLASLDADEPHSRGGPTICFNGRTMYVASSHLLRHALSALFHHTELHLESARFEGRSRSGTLLGSRSSIHQKSEAKALTNGSGPERLIVRLRFEGISRVSSHPHTYTVIFRYEFDRNTGMIIRHVVDNIQPVPGSKVWAGLTNAWGNLSPCGAAGAGTPGGGGPSACSAHQPSKSP